MTPSNQLGRYPCDVQGVVRWLLLEGKVDVPYLERLRLTGCPLNILNDAWDTLPAEDRDLAREIRRGTRTLSLRMADKVHHSHLKDAGFVHYDRHLLAVPDLIWDFLASV